LNTNGTVTIEVGPEGGPPSSILVLPVNPDQQLTQDYRVTAVQTLSGIYTDDFGIGISQIQLSGTTAFSVGQGRFNGQPVDGDTAAKNLYLNILNYYFQREENVPGTTIMEIFDDAFGRAWQVKPIGQLQLTRSSSSPLTLNYSQTFIILKDYLTNAPQTKTPDPIKAIWQTTTSVQSQTKKNVSQATNKAKTVKQTKDFQYTVQSGDTLWAIAARYLPKQATPSQIQNLVNQITSVNRLRNPNLIFVGERLTIPA